jgi:hypothetical protein
VPQKSVNATVPRLLVRFDDLILQNHALHPRITKIEGKPNPRRHLVRGADAVTGRCYGMTPRVYSRQEQDDASNRLPQQMQATAAYTQTAHTTRRSLHERDVPGGAAPAG